MDLGRRSIFAGCALIAAGASGFVHAYVAGASRPPEHVGCARVRRARARSVLHPRRPAEIGPEAAVARLRRDPIVESGS
jgi:hypothetical protein